MGGTTTVVKVHALTPEEAIEMVNNLLTDSGDYTNYNGQSPFDYCREEDTKISDEITTEEQFQELRATEREEYHYAMAKAAELSPQDSMKGYYLKMAGEALETDNFWSSSREAYEYADSFYAEEPPENAKIFYVDTYRHS